MVLAVDFHRFSLDDTRRVGLPGLHPHDLGMRKKDLWIMNDANYICSRYLLLPTTFDTDPQLRFSKSVVTVVLICLLVAGYSLTVLLFVACPSLLFRQDFIFIPTASVSAFSFFAILYSIASSKRYKASLAACPISLGLSASSVTLFSAIAFYTSRRIKALNSKRARIQEWRQSDPRSSPTPTVTQYPDPPLSSTNSIPLNYGSSSFNNGSTTTIGRDAPAPNSGSRKSPYMSPSYYANFIANMHPTARNTAPYDPPASDDELVAAQMAGLLHKKDGPSPDPSQSTFRLDWTFRDDDEPDPATGARRRPTFEMPPADAGRDRRRGQRGGRGASVGPAPRGKAAKAGPATEGQRGRPDSRGGEPERAKSREERRREIELGNMGA